jgi:hypothetical protein
MPNQIRINYENSNDTGFGADAVDVGYVPISLWNTKNQLADVDNLNSSYLFWDK